MQLMKSGFILAQVLLHAFLNISSCSVLLALLFVDGIVQFPTECEASTAGGAHQWIPR